MNNITFADPIALIELNNEQRAIIDIEDVAIVKPYCWRVMVGYSTCYARASVKSKPLLMHRLLMQPKNGMQVIDHINHNGLDNRRSNLRICDDAHNGQNRKSANRNSVSKVRNVCRWKSAEGKEYWIASVRPHGKLHVRYFPFTEEGLELAKQAAEDLRKEHFTHA